MNIFFANLQLSFTRRRVFFLFRHFFRHVQHTLTIFCIFNNTNFLILVYVLGVSSINQMHSIQNVCVMNK